MWVACGARETEGDREVWLTVVSTPPSFDGRTLRVLLRMRAIGLSCGTAMGSLIVSLVSRGRSAGNVCVAFTGERRMIIWRVELTLDTSIANSCSIAVSKS